MKLENLAKFFGSAEKFIPAVHLDDQSVIRT